jgi:hypothetical protein
MASLSKKANWHWFSDEDRFADGTLTYRVLDSTAPLEGGYCRCERGPRVSTFVITNLFIYMYTYHIYLTLAAHPGFFTDAMLVLNKE